MSLEEQLIRTRYGFAWTKEGTPMPVIEGDEDDDLWFILLRDAGIEQWQTNSIKYFVTGILKSRFLRRTDVQWNEFIRWYLLFTEDASRKSKSWHQRIEELKTYKRIAADREKEKRAKEEQERHEERTRKQEQQRREEVEQSRKKREDLANSARAIIPGRLEEIAKDDTKYRAATLIARMEARLPGFLYLTDEEKEQCYQTYVRLKRRFEYTLGDIALKPPIQHRQPKPVADKYSPTSDEKNERLNRITTTIAEFGVEANDQKATRIVDRLSQNREFTNERQFCLSIAAFTAAVDNDLMIENMNEIQFGSLTLSAWYDRYLQRYRVNYPPQLRSMRRMEVPELATVSYPFKSKAKLFQNRTGIVAEERVPDHQLKPLKILDRPYFSPHFHSWEIDFAFAQHPTLKNQLLDFLYIININTRFLAVFPTKDRSSGEVIRCLAELMLSAKVKHVRGDGERSFASADCKTFYRRNNIRYFFSGSYFTNKNKIVDSVIRTIRNAFGNDIMSFRDNAKVQQMVQYYNNTPHSAFKNKLSPIDVQNDEELEANYIRMKEEELRKVKELQQLSGIKDYQPGNVLMCHVDFSKTQFGFEKRRRNFNELTVFVGYNNGNVVCDLLREFNKLRRIEIPIQFTKIVSGSIQQLTPAMKREFGIRS